MRTLTIGIALYALVSGGVNAVVPQWGQCGGLYWTGETTCVAGTVCHRWNDWYWQCIASSTTAAPTSSTRTSSSARSSSTIRTTSSTRRSSTTSRTSSSATPTSTLVPLHDLARSVGKQYFGVAVDTNEIANATYRVLLDNTRLFGQITPGNKQKWDATEPSRNVFTYSAADAIVSWALGGGRQIRGHTLVWHSQLPNWVTSGGFNNATLVSILQNHVSNLVTHFRGQVKTWDVTNEIFEDDGSWRSSVFYNTIGEWFVDIAFRAAAAADPNVGLAANDYNLDYGGAKVNAYVNLVNRLKSRGVKITEVGSQAHLIVGSVPSYTTLVSNFQAFVNAGVDVAITELDIRMTLPATPALLAQQKRDYNTVVRACMAVPRCIGITIWAYSDHYSWIPSVFSGQGAALPWDEHLQPKPAFYGIVDGLNGITSA